MNNDKELHFVLGLYFQNLIDIEPGKRHRLWLIKKNRPVWQAGFLNAIGGHVKENESPRDAMFREFHEETGLKIPDWKNFCVMHHGPARVDCYTAVGTDTPQQMTDEAIHGIDMFHIHHYPGMMPNLPVLIAMAELSLDSPSFKNAFMRTELSVWTY